MTIDDVGGHSLNLIEAEHAIGRRVVVVGGGGKTSLARAISDQYGLRHVELDALFWLPGWQESEAGDFRNRVNDALDRAADGWVADGNYSSALGDAVLARADMVIWVNMPWRTMFWRVLKRSFKRAWGKQQICGENTENWRQVFSARSLWWFHIRNRGRYNQRDAMLFQMMPLSTPIVRLDTPSQLDGYYEIHSLTRPAGL